MLMAIVYFPGLPQGQEKPGNLKQWQKSGKVGKKWGILKKCQENSGNFIKWKKVRFCQFKFTKFLTFQSLQMVKN